MDAQRREIATGRCVWSVKDAKKACFERKVLNTPKIGAKKMNCVAIACETLRDEYADAAAKCNCLYETRWIKSGLHNYPEKLRNTLQQELDDISASKVLLCFGTCGNSVTGLKTRDFELIIPRVDDCISLLLGSVARRMKINAAHTSYFLTAGWLRGERNIHVEYEHAINKYGEELGKSIMSAILKNYEDLVLLDTESYDLEHAKAESEVIAEKLDLNLRILPASTDYITELLTGPHSPERFFIIPPNKTVGNLELLL